MRGDEWGCGPGSQNNTWRGEEGGRIERKKEQLWYNLVQ